MALIAQWNRYGFLCHNLFSSLQNRTLLTSVKDPGHFLATLWVSPRSSLWPLWCRAAIPRNKQSSSAHLREGPQPDSSCPLNHQGRKRKWGLTEQTISFGETLLATGAHHVSEIITALELHTETDLLSDLSFETYALWKMWFTGEGL